MSQGGERLGCAGCGLRPMSTAADVGCQMRADVLVIIDDENSSHCRSSTYIALGVPGTGADETEEFPELCPRGRATCGTPRLPFPRFASRGRASSRGTNGQPERLPRQSDSPPWGSGCEVYAHSLCP